MKIINRDRGTGKTTMLIHTALVTGMPIIAMNLYHQKYILDLCNRLGCDVPAIYTVEEWINSRGLMIYKEQPKVLIDEAGAGLIQKAVESYLGNCTVAAMTTTIPMVEASALETEEE